MCSHRSNQCVELTSVDLSRFQLNFEKLMCLLFDHIYYIIEFALETQTMATNNQFICIVCIYRNNVKSEMNDTPFVHCVLMLHFIGRCSTFSHQLSMHTKNCGPICTDVHFFSDTDFYYCVHCCWPHNL